MSSFYHQVLGEAPSLQAREPFMPSSASDKALPLKDVRILVTDDDPLSLEVTRLTLMSRGAQVDVAGSGLAAVEKTACVAYDALLIDERMPGMPGSEAIAQIRARVHGDRVCIVAMVPRSDACAGERVLAAGANGWLAKPVSPRHLLGTITQCLGTRRSTPPDVASVQEHPMPQPPAEFAQLRSLEVTQAIARLGGNAGLYRQTLIAFTRGHADALSDIRSSLLGGEWEAAHRQTHTLKGICGTIGAMALHARLQALENEIQACSMQEALLEAVDAMLPEFQSLRDDVRRYAIAQASPGSGGLMVPLTASQLKALLDEARSLLANDDASAARAIEKIALQAKAQFPAAAWEPFVTYGMSYEFDKALEALTVLECSLKMGSSSGD